MTRALPPLIRDQRKVDADHLKLLGIFHFVYAGMAGLGTLFLVGHFALLRAFFSNPKIWEAQKQAPPPAELFEMFGWFYLIFGAWLVSAIALNVIAGLCIRARMHRTFCMVVAGINCVRIPVGTVLGVFTIVVMARDSVRELYEA